MATQEAELEQELAALRLRVATLERHLAPVARVLKLFGTLLADFEEPPTPDFGD